MIAVYTTVVNPVPLLRVAAIHSRGTARNLRILNSPGLRYVFSPMPGCQHRCQAGQADCACALTRPLTFQEAG
jgi:hypothetical protein